MKKELAALERKVFSCRACGLWKYRKKAVFGEGDENARIMLIGLGPGYWENVKGKPFVGPAGKLLDSLLALAGLERERIYITNIVKCFPPNNSPSKEQVKICTSLYLERQMELISPKVVIPLGNLASEWVFGKYSLKQAPMHKIHGKIFEVKGSKVNFIIPMYHPASALRNPGLRKTLVEDWKRIREFLQKFK